MALNLIMMGPAGAGKGTQAERFAQARGIPRISTGDILREAVHNGSDIGRRAAVTMARGELVSDDEIIGIVRERVGLDDARTGFVLDGFPRTVTQATALYQMITGRATLIIVEIVVPEAELVRRLSMRMVCEDCGTTARGFEERGNTAADKVVTCQRCGGRLMQRSDDDDAIVRERLKVYMRQTKPLVEYYHARPTFRSVNGSQPPDRVAAELGAIVEAASNGLAVKGTRL